MLVQWLAFDFLLLKAQFHPRQIPFLAHCPFLLEALTPDPIVRSLRAPAEPALDLHHFGFLSLRYFRQ